MNPLEMHQATVYLDYLNLQVGATLWDVEEAHKRLLARYQPWLIPGDTTSREYKRLCEIDQAYSWLSRREELLANLADGWRKQRLEDQKAGAPVLQQDSSGAVNSANAGWGTLRVPQRRVVAGGLLLAAATAIYPPWERVVVFGAGKYARIVEFVGHAPIFDPPTEALPKVIQIAYSRLFIYWAVIILGTVAVLVLERDPAARKILKGLW